MSEYDQALPNRLASAVPDAVWCGICLLVWFFPMTLGAAWIKSLMATIALEFAILHSNGVMLRTLADPHATHGRKASVLLRFGAFYSLMVAAFCVAFETWWPVVTFACLLAGKVVSIWQSRLPSHEEQSRQWTITLVSVALFLIGVPLVAQLPVPEFGIDAVARAAADLPAGTDWDDTAHRVIAFGTLYFAVQAWTKWRWRPGGGVKIEGARRR